MKAYIRIKSACLFLVWFSPFLCTPVNAHDGKPHSFGDLWFTWALDPLVIVSLALTAWLYIRGARRMWRELTRSDVWAFAAGWFALFVALVSPLHPWGEVLFSAHMTQHEILMLVAAPLLVLSRPVVPMLWALPLGWRYRLGGLSKKRRVQQVWQVITYPLAAWIIHAIALWIWHVPALFQATLRSDLVHTLQHVSFLFSALLFWWALIHGRGFMGYGAAVLYLFTTSVHSGLLGALLTFTRRLWYPAYAETTASWGLTPLEDQQLGGLIMWVPAGFIYVIAGLALFAGWLREAQHRVERYDKQRLIT